LLGPSLNPGELADFGVAQACRKSTPAAPKLQLLAVFEAAETFGFEGVGSKRGRAAAFRAFSCSSRSRFACCHALNSASTALLRCFNEGLF
jgi:hypothetical protein